MKTLEVRSPYSGKLLDQVPFTSLEEAQGAIQKATEAFRKWRNSSAWERSQLLTHAAVQLENQKEDFASLICEEAGKPIQLARGEVDRAIGVLRWASGEAQRFSGELLRLDAGPTGRPGFGIHTRFPKGVILGITPFNFPLNLALHKVAPAIASGCSIIIKPSPFTPLSAAKMASLFDGAPSGLVQVILPEDQETSQLTQHPQIAMISFTGSAKVGFQIRKQAPEKPTALELGGNAWVVIMEDTPPSYFPAIAKRIANAAFGYAGQSCISVQNVAIAADLWPTLQEQLQSHTEATHFGDPAISSVITGPVIHSTAADRIRTQLQKIPTGATLTSSKNKLGSESSSSLLAPTLICLPGKDIGKSSLVQEELFAPIMIARKFNEITDLIETINSSRYGLQTGVYTQNWTIIEKLYKELDVGGVVVNDVPTTRYDHQPYGGIKESGQGREGLRYAMEEMTDSKFLALSSHIPI